jgi:hypothetical protein
MKICICINARTHKSINMHNSDNDANRTIVTLTSPRLASTCFALQGQCLLQCTVQMCRDKTRNPELETKEDQDRHHQDIMMMPNASSRGPADADAQHALTGAVRRGSVSARTTRVRRSRSPVLTTPRAGHDTCRNRINNMSISSSGSSSTGTGMGSGMGVGVGMVSSPPLAAERSREEQHVRACTSDSHFDQLFTLYKSPPSHFIDFSNGLSQGYGSAPPPRAEGHDQEYTAPPRRLSLGELPPPPTAPRPGGGQHAHAHDVGSDAAGAPITRAARRGGTAAASIPAFRGGKGGQGGVDAPSSSGHDRDASGVVPSHDMSPRVTWSDSTHVCGQESSGGPTSSRSDPGQSGAPSSSSCTTSLTSTHAHVTAARASHQGGAASAPASGRRMDSRHVNIVGERNSTRAAETKMQQSESRRMQIHRSEQQKTRHSQSRATVLTIARLQRGDCLGEIHIWGGYHAWKFSAVVAEEDCEVAEMPVHDFLTALPPSVARLMFHTALHKCL